MSDAHPFWKETLSSLKQQRDELAVQIQLGKAEAKEEWERLRTKLDKLNDDYQPVKEAINESASDVVDSLKLVAGEIKEGFDRIRKSLNEK